MMLVIIEIYVLMSILIEMISYFQKQKQQNTIVKTMSNVRVEIEYCGG